MTEEYTIAECQICRTWIMTSFEDIKSRNVYCSDCLAMARRRGDNDDFSSLLKDLAMLGRDE